jgi:hypothetical protein
MPSKIASKEFAMTHTIFKITREIRRDLPRAEADVDTALLSLSSLMSTLVSARIESGAAAGTGHRALLEIVKAQDAVVIASAAVAKAHSAMISVGREMGAHDIDECPRVAGKADAPLKVVA